MKIKDCLSENKHLNIEIMKDEILYHKYFIYNLLK